jgi:plasmid stability protein
MNLTITLDEEVVRRARIRALEQGTSVNAVVRRFLESYAGRDEARQARGRLAALSSGLPVAERAAQGRGWKREEIYAERVSERPDEK